MKSGERHMTKPTEPTQPTIDASSVADVLAEIADIASETLELHEVFDRVAAAVHRLIPFDNMGVVRILDGAQVVLHATTLPCPNDLEKCFDPMPLHTWSPRWRPHAGPMRRIEDAAVELDPSFEMDAHVLKDGMRSGMWEPFQQRKAFVGGVWLCSTAPHTFTEEHQIVLRPIAALLGSAVEHWRIWDGERQRTERLDRVEALLGTLAGSLDVREIFQKVSDEMQPILAHDLLNLTELDEKARTIRISAFAGGCDIPLSTDPFPLSDIELEQWADFQIIDDVHAEMKPDTERRKLILASGMHSWLRVPVWLSGELKGSLSFLHREPGRYDLEDAEVARRLADRIALSLSLQKLADEARISAEARERAEALEATVVTLSQELAIRDLRRVVGVSRSWKETLGQVSRVAGSETTVLITGESGTGKEVIANMIQRGSKRAGRPFVAINCAALPEQLLESELFGHEKGAFTGAAATKIGRLEQAAGGTLFLDEIAEMSPLVQAKFLRVLQEREFQRLGGTRTLKADVRVIAATNRDLTAAMAAGQFRDDLYYRLNVFEIRLPALRDRTEDIPVLADTFLGDLGRAMGRPAAGISRDAQQWMLEYNWPGNVRELRNAIERAILLCDGGLITRDHLPAVTRRPAAAVPKATNGNLAHDSALPAGGVDLEAVERDFVEKALGQSQGNKSKAARLLGLSRGQLYSRLEKYGIR
jgi:transcriptional regulator with GAF, ATPase, and Fis domain